MTVGALYQDAELAIARMGEWIRITPVGAPVLAHESARAGLTYRAIEIPLPRLAGVSHNGLAGGKWWLRFTGCFSGFYDHGTQEGTFVDIGPISKDAAINATGRIRAAVPMPRLEPVESLGAVLGTDAHVWLTLVTRWRPSLSAPSELDGAHVVFPRDGAPPPALHGSTLSIRGLLEGNVLHVLSWTALHGDAVREVLGQYSTLVPSDLDDAIPSGAAPAVRPTTAIQAPTTSDRVRPFDRFDARQRIHTALLEFPHGRVSQVGPDRWQVDDALLGTHLRGSAVLVCTPLLSRVELTIPCGAAFEPAAVTLGLAIAELSVYGVLTSDRGGPVDPAGILRSLVERPPTAAPTESLAFVDGSRRVPFEVRHAPSADTPAMVFHARVDWDAVTASSRAT